MAQVRKCQNCRKDKKKCEPGQDSSTCSRCALKGLNGCDLGWPRPRYPAPSTNIAAISQQNNRASDSSSDSTPPPTARSSTQRQSVHGQLNSGSYGVATNHIDPNLSSPLQIHGYDRQSQTTRSQQIESTRFPSYPPVPGYPTLTLDYAQQTNVQTYAMPALTDDGSSLYTMRMSRSGPLYPDSLYPVTGMDTMDRFHTRLPYADTTFSIGAQQPQYVDRPYNNTIPNHPRQTRGLGCSTCQSNADRGAPYPCDMCNPQMS